MLRRKRGHTANLCTKILGFRSFDSSIILILWDGITISIMSFPEMLSQQILVWIILVGILAAFFVRIERRRGHVGCLVDTSSIHWDTVNRKLKIVTHHINKIGG